VPLLPRSLRIELLDGGVALSRGFAQRRNKSFGGAGLWSWSLMSRRKHVEPIPRRIALAARTDQVLTGIGSTPAARDNVVDGGLIGSDVATEKGGAAAPVTPLVCIQPQDRTSGQLVSGCLFYMGLTFSQGVEAGVKKPSLWRLGCGGV
jgi:hypothetical protein